MVATRRSTVLAPPCHHRIASPADDYGGGLRWLARGWRGALYRNPAPGQPQGRSSAIGPTAVAPPGATPMKPNEPPSHGAEETAGR